MPATLRLPTAGGGRDAHRRGDTEAGAGETGRPTTPMGRARAALGPFVLLLAACLGLAGCFPQVKETTKKDREGPKPPNVVLVLADDLAQGDVNPRTLEHMPHLRALIEEGTTFDNSFVTNSFEIQGRLKKSTHYGAV